MRRHFADVNENASQRDEAQCLLNNPVTITRNPPLVGIEHPHRHAPQNHRPPSELDVRPMVCNALD
jgi:hypothetical protein